MRCDLTAALVLTYALIHAGLGSAADDQQQVTGPAQDAAATEAEVMKQWQELATPGKPHEAHRKGNAITRIHGSRVKPE